MPNREFLPEEYHPISPRFKIGKGTKQGLEFVWDGAAMGPNGEILLIEDETSTIVNIHIEGHVSRVGLMLAEGIRVKSLIWVVNPKQFGRLWRIAEHWRWWMWETMQIPTPAFEYRSIDSTLLAFSAAKRGAFWRDENA